MRYALLLHMDRAAAERTSEEEAAAEMARYEALTAELAAEGVLRGGEAFMPAATARLIQMTDGALAVSTVPVAERELAGLYIVECDEDAAVAIAQRIPVATHGAVEIRPLMEPPEPPY